MTSRILALVHEATGHHFLSARIPKKAQIQDGRRKMISLVLIYETRQA